MAKKIKAKKVRKISKKIVKKELPKDKLLFLKSISIKLFGNMVDKNIAQFNELKQKYMIADIGILFRTYLAIMFFLPVLIFISSAIIVAFSCFLLKSNTALAIIWTIIVSGILSSTTILALYTYPIIIARKRKTDIEANLPFAINHMSAIASSGAPPYLIFKILSNFKEYGEISRQSSKIVRDIDFFGLDEISALRERINKTPSPQFRELLEGLLATIHAGGSLKNYLNQESEKALFDYRLSRERYSELLSVYADIYTALLIAAPLLFIAILSVLSIVGGNIFGMPIDETMKIGIFGVIPVLNVLFLLFIHITQPKV